MKDTVTKALKHTFGSSTEIKELKTITDKARNTTANITCSSYEKPIFIKIEKDFDLPRTQKFQIKREEAGLRLCREKGVNVPKVIAFDVEGTISGSPWIMEEFIEGELLFDLEQDDLTKKRLGIEFEQQYKKLLSVTSEKYGDTFSGGLIGRHTEWKDAITSMSNLLFEDCMQEGVFNNEESQIVNKALTKAVSDLKCKTKPAMFHYDLFSMNVFGIISDGQITLGPIIDFGMSVFAPEHYVQYITRKFTDFQLPEMYVQTAYGISDSEIKAYDILRIEPILMMHMIQYRHYAQERGKYVKACSDYIYS